MDYKKIINWISHNRLEFFLISLIILLSLFMRVYKIDQYMTFLGDEGRDALMIKRILTTGDVPLIGPATSIGNMYLGPLYYYMMSVPMAMFWLNPVAAAVMVAFIGTLSTLLVYYLGREWFGKVGGLFSAALFGLSPVLITYSRSSWNPNPAPFFALLIIASFYWLRKYKDNRFLILAAISFAFLVQMHYLALLMIGVIAVLWIYELVIRWKEKRAFLIHSSFASLAFLLLMSPLLIFDLKHNFMNTNAVIAFFTNRQETVNLNSLNTIERVWPIFFDKFLFKYLGGQNTTLTLILSAIIIGLVLFFVYKILKQNPFSLDRSWPYFTIITWFAIGILGVSLYKQNIYDHYLLFISPVPYLILAAGIVQLNKKFQIGTAVLILVVLGYFNLAVSPLRIPPNNQLKRTQDIAKHIITKADNKPFNFALLSKYNYDSAYQFYLDLYGHKPRLVSEDVTDQLFVVCEDPICEPINNAKYEIAGFGWSKIDYQEDFMGIKVFKLIANKDRDQAGKSMR